MPRKQQLSQPLEENGVFWNPADPDKKFPATLKSAGRQISLVTAAEFSDLAQSDIGLFMATLGINQVAEPIPYLLGTVGGSPCTLIWLHQLNDGGFHDLARMQSVTYRQFRVSVCILGLHLDGKNANALTSARFSYSALKHWQRAKFEIITTDEVTTLVYPRKEPPLVQIDSSDGQVSLTFDIKPEIRLEGSGVRIRNEAVLELRPLTPQSLQWMFNIGYRMENYFCLLLGSSLMLKSIALGNGDAVGWCRRRSKGKTEKVKHQITVKPSVNEFSVTMIRWLELPSTFNPLSDCSTPFAERGFQYRLSFWRSQKRLKAFIA